MKNLKMLSMMFGCVAALCATFSSCTSDDGPKSLTKEEVQTADIVGSGGGEGLWNFSYGANAEFADMAVEVLQEYGFQEKNNECNRN